MNTFLSSTTFRNIFPRVLTKGRSIIRKYSMFLKIKFGRYQLKIDSSVQFIQKTIFTGDGLVNIGEGCSFGYRLGGGFQNGVCELQARYSESKIRIGKDVAVNNNLFICAASEVTIGNNCLIGEGVLIIDHDAHGIDPSQRRASIGKVSPILLGENVWIGSKVIVLPGTKIGNNSIIGAGSVVKGEYPENVIIAGNPARIIKEL